MKDDRITWPYLLMKDGLGVSRATMTNEDAWRALMDGIADKIMLDTGLAIKKLKKKFEQAKRGL